MTQEREHTWPALPYVEWQETATTLHMWTQIVGKIRLAQTPWVNHSWHVTLYVTPSGLTTGAIPHGDRSFSIYFDFLDHRLVIRASTGKTDAIPLRSMDTADFYARLMASLDALDMPVEIHGSPNEVPDPIPFAEDRMHNTYDAGAANRFWRVLLNADRVFSQFRADFHGKSSPVHFFWGSFDLAVTRFSGRPAPDHPGGLPNMPLWVAQEAYSQEVASAGFWPGSDDLPEPIFYAYAYPSPEGFAAADVGPDGACWSKDLGEFVLPLDAMRAAADPDAALLQFLNDSFDAAARLADWDLETLKRRHFPPGA